MSVRESPACSGLFRSHVHATLCQTVNNVRNDTLYHGCTPSLADGIDQRLPVSFGVRSGSLSVLFGVRSGSQQLVKRDELHRGRRLRCRESCRR